MEVADAHEVVHLRDAKDPGGPRLTFSRPVWHRFVTALATGRYDAAGRSMG